MADAKQEVIARLSAAYTALDHVTVSGRSNFNNMSVGMGIIDELLKMVKQYEIAEIVEHKSGEKKT